LKTNIITVDGSHTVVVVTVVAVAVAAGVTLKGKERRAVVAVAVVVAAASVAAVQSTITLDVTTKSVGSHAAFVSGDDFVRGAGHLLNLKLVKIVQVHDVRSFVCLFDRSFDRSFVGCVNLWLFWFIPFLCSKF
jgi:hypothetical protein